MLDGPCAVHGGVHSSSSGSGSGSGSGKYVVILPLPLNEATNAGYLVLFGIILCYFATCLATTQQ